MADLCFIDTETTSLRHDRRAWEVGVIARTDGVDAEYRWLIDTDHLDLGNADLMSLKIGRFYERHPQMNAASLGEAYDEPEVLWAIEDITRGAHLVGAVVSFDADVLGQRMRANGICPSWHYHLIDVEALAVGWLSAMAYEASGTSLPHEIEWPSLPWKSDDLSAALGVKVSDEDRHTALGDARWARDLYDVMLGGAK